MAGDVSWIESPRILGVQYTGDVTAADVKHISRQCLEVLRVQPVYFAVDLSNARSIDPNILQLSSFTEWIDHPNARWFAYIGAKGLFKTLIQVRQRGTSKLFDKRADAVRFLQGVSAEAAGNGH